MVRIIIISVLAFVLINCAGDKKESKPAKSVLNIKVGSDLVKDVNYSSLVSEVKYLALESKDECLFGQITKIEFDDNKIFILDRWSYKGLLVFDDQGKFLYSLKQGGGAENEFEIINGFVLDKRKKKFKILSASSILHFTYEGVFIKREKIDFLADNFEGIDDVYAFSGTEHALIISDSSYQIKQKVFPWDKIYILSLIQPFQQVENGIIWRHSLSDTIYLINDGQAFPYRFIDFQEKALSTVEIDDLIKRQSKELPSDKMHSIKFYNESRSMVNFAFRYQNKFVTTLYDKESERVISFFVDGIKNDVTFEPMSPLIEGIKDDTFVASIDLENVTIESLDYSKNPHLKPFLDICVGKDLKTNSYNPVLAFIKFKSI